MIFKCLLKKTKTLCAWWRISLIGLMYRATLIRFWGDHHTTENKENNMHIGSIHWIWMVELYTTYTCFHHWYVQHVFSGASVTKHPAHPTTLFLFSLLHHMHRDPLLFSNLNSSFFLNCLPIIFPILWLILQVLLYLAGSNHSGQYQNISITMDGWIATKLGHSFPP